MNPRVFVGVQRADAFRVGLWHAADGHHDDSGEPGFDCPAQPGAWRAGFLFGTMIRVLFVQLLCRRETVR